MGARKDRRRKSIPTQGFTRNRVKMGTPMSARILRFMRFDILFCSCYQVLHITFPLTKSFVLPSLTSDSFLFFIQFCIQPCTNVSLHNTMNSYQLLSSGSNAKGQLGQNNLEDTSVFRPCYFISPTGGSITTVCPGKPLAICCGSNHTILLLRSTLSSRQEIWSCGDSRYTQPDFELSENSPSHSTVFRRLDNKVLSSLRLHPEQHELEPHTVAASWNTTFAVFRPIDTADGRNSRDILVSFGSNELGNLGLGRMPHELPNAFAPLQIQLWELFFSTYGNELSGFQIIHLVAGVHHIILVARLYVGDLDILRVVGWGSCRHGQLGQTPQCKDHILSRPSYLPLDAEIDSLALGNQHTIFLQDSGRIQGLGSNRKGQLDGLDDIFSGIQIGTTWRGSYVVYRHPGEIPESWHIFSTEKGKKRPPEHSNNSSTQIIQFPFDTATRQFVKLACGSEHVLVCLKRVESRVPANEVWGWGWNEHGNLGVGSTESINDPTLIYRTSDGEEVINVWAGYSTSWIAVQN